MKELDLVTVLSVLGSVASLVGIPLALMSILQARNAARRSEREARASKEASIQAKSEVEKFRGELRLITTKYRHQIRLNHLAKAKLLESMV
jgi:hypothetical protein